MKKVISLFLTLIFLTAHCYATSTTITERNKYGQKVATYTTNGNTTTARNKYGQKTATYTTKGNVTVERNKYGQKTATYKTDNKGNITKYDKYGRKVRSYK